MFSKKPSRSADFKKILLWIFVLGVFKITTMLTFAAPVGGREVKLSEPIGRDILPGGDFTASDIRGSFIFSKLIPFLTRYGLQLAVAFSVVALIIGGYRFMTSYGNSEQKDAAQKTIQYALIGLIIALTALGIVTIVSNITFS